MTFKQAKYLRRKTKMFDGLIYKNPVLISGFALPYAIVSGFTLKNAVAMSIATLFAIMPVAFIGTFGGKYLKTWIRTPLFVLISALCLLPTRMILSGVDPLIFDSVGMFFSIISVSSMVVILPNVRNIVHEKPYMVLLDALGHCIGFAIAICMVGTVREIMTYGTIWGIDTKFPSYFRSIGFSLSFGGFITVAFFSALFHRIAAFIKKRNLNNELLGVHIPKKIAHSADMNNEII